MANARGHYDVVYKEKRVTVLFDEVNYKRLRQRAVDLNTSMSEMIRDETLKMLDRDETTEVKANTDMSALIREEIRKMLDSEKGESR